MAENDKTRRNTDVFDCKDNQIWLSLIKDVINLQVFGVTEPGLNVPVEEMINFNHRQLHSVAESLDRQGGPSQGLLLAICKRLDSRPSPSSRPGAAVPSCALCIAVREPGTQMRPNLCLHSGFHDKE